MVTGGSSLGLNVMITLGRRMMKMTCKYWDEDIGWCSKEDWKSMALKRNIDTFTTRRLLTCLVSRVNPDDNERQAREKIKRRNIVLCLELDLCRNNQFNLGLGGQYLRFIL